MRKKCLAGVATRATRSIVEANRERTGLSHTGALRGEETKANTFDIGSVVMIRTAIFVSSVVGLAASAANADLAFSFADPVGGRQLTYAQDNSSGIGTGQMTYSTTTNITFIIDGSAEPTPFAGQNYTAARMEMQLFIGISTTNAGVTQAAVLPNSFFRIYDSSVGTGASATILRGDANGGAFIRFGGTNSVLLSDITGFTYTFGTILQNLLVSTGNSASVPAVPQEAVFTITDVLTNRNPAGGFAPIIGPNGVIASFTANSSFSGNTATIPTPGALALVGIGGLVAARRRRA